MPQENFILLIEDNPDDIELLRRAVQKVLPHYQLVVVSTGNEALSFVSNERRYLQKDKGKPSLVFLDLNLPQVNGFVLLEVMNRFGWLASVPVVVVSNSVEKADELESLEVGALEFVRKPLSTRKVQELLDKYVPQHAKRDKPSGAVSSETSSAVFSPAMTGGAGGNASLPETTPLLAEEADD